MCLAAHLSSSAGFQPAVSQGFQPASLSECSCALELPAALPIGNRRYSRLETCATLNKYKARAYLLSPEFSSGIRAKLASPIEKSLSAISLSANRAASNRSASVQKMVATS